MSPQNTNHKSRRDFFKITVAAALAGTVKSKSTFAAASADPDMTICIFSKHLQWLDYDATARTAAELGFDGLDLTVRPGGHVLPERVKDDLPRIAAAARKASITVPMMATDITDPSSPLTRTVLETAGKLGIRNYRLGTFRYNPDQSIPKQLNELKPVFRDLAAINKEYNLHGALQNHAGNLRVGAALWDTWQLLQDIDPRWLGCQYDIRHATVEGGLAWPTNFQLIAPHVKTIIAKDFLWLQKDQKWTLENCPLGRGMVEFPRYFNMVKQAAVPGPVSLHLEYPIAGANHGAGKLTADKSVVLNAMTTDLATLKQYLRNAQL